MFTVLLADDHQVVRLGVRAVLEREPDLRVVAEVADGRQVVPTVDRLRPDVLVLDLVMPGVNGLDTVREVALRVPDTRLVVQSMYAHEAYVCEALQRGAAAYVVKGSDATEVVRAIRAALAGRRYLSPPLSEAAIETYRRNRAGGPFDPYETLTEREREVLRWVAEGLTSAEIGARLFISRRTVETHRANIFRKLGLRTQSEVVRYALRRGLLPLDR